MKVRISNRLYIEQPTSAVKAYCQKNLVLDNPDFYKAEKQGRWTGNIPRKIMLYEIHGVDYWLPFGCLQDVWRIHPYKSDYINEISPIEPIKYESSINLYPYQTEAVHKALYAKNGVLVMPCGSGKTQCGLEIIARLGGRALWLTHTQDLLNQSKSRAESVLGKEGYGTITAGKVNIGTHITFATVQTMAKLDLSQYRGAWDVLIVDECMPGNTLIDTSSGRKELKNLCKGDIITSFNRNTGQLENKPITHIFKNKAHNIVSVNLENGEKIICTDNHPIFTNTEQWVDAGRLKNDDYVLRLVRQGSRYRCNADYNKKQNKKKGVLLLLERMFCKRRSQKGCVDRRTQTESICNNEEYKQSVSRSVCGENENRQSHEKARSSESCIKQAERDRTSSKNQMWKWDGINSSTTDVNDCTCRNTEQCVCRISDTNKNAEGERISDLLQSGYCVTGISDSDRDRRKFTLCDRTSESGQEENRIFEWVRVESVTVQEQTSDGTFGGLCADGYVYNIEVADNNNYFANGVLVHNCQHCCGSPTRVTQFYKVVSSLSARHKYGLTATPKRADRLEAAMFAILGGKIHEVSREEVAHTTCPVKVSVIQTGWMPDYEAVLMYDGTIDYNKVIDAMIHDEERFKLVMREILHLYVPTMVLANRVEYLQRMCDEAKKHNMKAVCLSGQGQSKKAKAERKQALEALNNGELDCIFATYQLAKEGLDVPNLRYVVFATPEQDSTTVIQAVGRVGRKAQGKEFGTVIDFVDAFGMYQGYWKKRKGYYKKIGAEVIE